MIAAQGQTRVYACLEGWQIFGVNLHGGRASGPWFVTSNARRLRKCP